MTRRESFWDRRRAAVAAEEEAQRATPPEAEETRSDDEMLRALDLPDPDSLRAGDDFAAFMAQAVPTHLRNRALRQLWRSNPVLACVDGLNDYDQDFLTGSTGNGPLKTAYRVGKGLVAHIDEQARRAPEADAVPEPAAQEPSRPEARATLAKPAEDAAPAPRAPEAETETADAQDAPPAPRRMRFAFEDTTP